MIWLIIFVNFLHRVDKLSSKFDALICSSHIWSSPDVNCAIIGMFFYLGDAVFMLDFSFCLIMHISNAGSCDFCALISTCIDLSILCLLTPTPVYPNYKLTSSRLLSIFMFSNFKEIFLHQLQSLTSRSCLWHLVPLTRSRSTTVTNGSLSSQNLETKTQLSITWKAALSSSEFYGSKSIHKTARASCWTRNRQSGINRSIWRLRGKQQQRNDCIIIKSTFFQIYCYYATKAV